MSATQQPADSRSDAQKRTKQVRIAVVLLVAGLAATAWLWITTPEMRTGRGEMLYIVAPILAAAGGLRLIIEARRRRR